MLSLYVSTFSNDLTSFIFNFLGGKKEMMYLENIFNSKLLDEYQGTITRSFHMYSTWYPSKLSNSRKERGGCNRIVFSIITESSNYLDSSKIAFIENSII